MCYNSHDVSVTFKNEENIFRYFRKMSASVLSARITVACFFFLCLMRSQTCAHVQSFSVENYVLDSHTEYKQVTGVSFAKCKRLCKSEKACISVNFEGSLDSEGCCTFNGCGVEDEEKIHESLVFSPGCTYHQLRPTDAAIAEVL